MVKAFLCISFKYGWKKQGILGRFACCRLGIPLLGTRFYISTTLWSYYEKKLPQKRQFIIFIPKKVGSLRETINGGRLQAYRTKPPALIGLGTGMLTPPLIAPIYHKKTLVTLFRYLLACFDVVAFSNFRYKPSQSTEEFLFG